MNRRRTTIVTGDSDSSKEPCRSIAWQAEVIRAILLRHGNAGIAGLIREMQ